MRAPRICGPFTSVPGETECYEAIWSKGYSCKKCDRADCYRQGWDQRSVTNDNISRVEKKIYQLNHQEKS